MKNPSVSTPRKSTSPEEFNRTLETKINNTPTELNPYYVEYQKVESDYYIPNDSRYLQINHAALHCVMGNPEMESMFQNIRMTISERSRFFEEYFKYLYRLHKAEGNRDVIGTTRNHARRQLKYARRVDQKLSDLKRN